MMFTVQQCVITCIHNMSLRQLVYRLGHSTCNFSYLKSNWNLKVVIYFQLQAQVAVPSRFQSHLHKVFFLSFCMGEGRGGEEVNCV